MSGIRGTVDDASRWWGLLERGIALFTAYPWWARAWAVVLVAGLFTLIVAYRAFLMSAARATLHLKFPLLQPAWQAFVQSNRWVRIGAIAWLVAGIGFGGYVVFVRPPTGLVSVPPDISELTLLDGKLLVSIADYEGAISVLEKFTEGNGRFQGSPILMSVVIHNLTGHVQSGGVDSPRT